MSNGKGNRGGSNPTRDYGNMVHQEVQEKLAEWLKQERDSHYDEEIFADHCAILGIGDDKDEVYDDNHNVDLALELHLTVLASLFD